MFFDSYPFRYMAEKSGNASRREREAKEKFDVLKGQVDLALYENMMTTLGLACHAKSESPLRLLAKDVMDQVLDYAGCAKPTDKYVKAAANAREDGSLAIVPTLAKKIGAPEEDPMDFSDLDFFSPGRKIVFPLTLPSHHLTGPCYRDFRKHVKPLANWALKRTAATAKEKKQYRETRKGKVYFVRAEYTVPGKASKKRKSAGGKRKSAGGKAKAADGGGKKPRAEKKDPTPVPLSAGAQSKATSALQAALVSAANNADGSVDPAVMQRAVNAGYSKFFVLGKIEDHLKGDTKPAAKDASSEAEEEEVVEEEEEEYEEDGEEEDSEEEVDDDEEDEDESEE